MSSNFYLPRSLYSNGKTYTEAELLTASNFVVVLAEPGAGKSELMGSLARKLGTAAITATKFGFSGAKSKNMALVIDGVDELAKIDASGIYKLFSEAEASTPTHVYLSSRSSEWDSATTHAFKDFLGRSPLLVKLCEFSEAEQRAIFKHHVGGENFRDFQTEVARFDLETLLPNPQFLKLFADAYLESGKHFKDKKSIFKLAVERLAKEANTQIARRNPALSSAQKVEISSEVFAKLLLSGAEGVGTNESTDNRMYPLLESLFADNNVVDGILATRLFKPGDNADHHRPVHKIVAEYCAASYLTKRIAAPGDPLTLSKCIPIIAPNSTVRDELRGLLGWMAAVGNTPIERMAIELDPYAVLANGDPSQLEHSSKRLLINQLKEMAASDPYFRRGDFWRRFSVAGFFTQEVMEEVKPILSEGGDGHLRDLILELLTGASATQNVTEELRRILLSPEESENTRFLASRCLLNLASHDHHADLAALISEASHTSLELATGIIETLGPKSFERIYLADFFRVCAKLYPGHQEQSERVIGARYFVKKFIECLDLPSLVWLLDELTRELTCKCGKEAYECDCRNGISKITGSMLDRYFTLTDPPYDPKRIWQWVSQLNFHEQKNADQSKAVEMLQKNRDLRRGIIAHAFGELTDREEILAKRDRLGWHAHSGLHFQAGDDKFLVDLAFETDNPALWASFIPKHPFHPNSVERTRNSFRRHVRKQALAKPSFMREWAAVNRTEAQFQRENRFRRLKRTRRIKRRQNKRDEIRSSNIEFILKNRELVESGQHWKSLHHFAQTILITSKNLNQEYGDETIVRTALRNCLNFIAPDIPDLLKLAELQCASQSLHSETILYAACLEIFRAEGSLESVELRLLKALRTNIYMGYAAVVKEEREALKAEIDRLIFPNTDSAEAFLRQYVEPQLAKEGCSHPQIGLLRTEDVFNHLRADISIEWLRRFDRLSLGPLDTLFEIAAQYGNRDNLKKIILDRCAELMSWWPSPTDVEEIENKRKFWLVRAWYFLKDTPEEYWDWLKVDQNTLLLFNARSGHMNLSEHPYWPKLTSTKVEAILDAFVDHWPKVDLPTHQSSESPEKENAYRFLTEVIWNINSDNPDEAIPVLRRLLANPRVADLHGNLKTIYASQIRKKALRDFEPPTPWEIVDQLDRDEIVTTEGLRQLALQELRDFQRAIDGGEFNSADRFYEKGDRLDEIRSTEIIAERLNLRLEPQGISVTPEHQLKGANRSDFTVTKVIHGRRRLLVTEVKGQWHKELYTAASSQLSERYSIHPDAEQQGIFLVIWFGTWEKVAGRKNHKIGSAQELKRSIEAKLCSELAGLIDVFVLDVSKA